MLRPFPGHVLTLDDLILLRPASGIAPKHQDAIVGRTLLHAVHAGQPLTWDDLSGQAPD